METLYDRGSNTIDGFPVVDLKGMPKGNLYAGDFDYMYYGIPFGMSYKLDESAQLSTLKNADGTPVNLFEQELVALRVTMDVAFMIVKDEAFGMSYKLDESAQLSTLKNADGTPVNLFEQELVALRVTMDVAFMIVKDEAFAKLEAGESKLEKLTVNSIAGTSKGDTKVTVTPSKTGGNSYKYKVSEEAVEVSYLQNVRNWTAWDGTADIKGDTKVTVTPSKTGGNSYKYKVSEEAVEVSYLQNVRNWTAWDGTADITAATGSVITVVECNAEFQAIKAGSKTVTAHA